MASFERVHEALRRRQIQVRSTNPRQLMASCPVHSERTPSLHITWREGHRGGYTLMHCFGCGAPAADLADSLGLTVADLFDEPLPERDRALTRVGKSPSRRQAARRRGRLGRLPAPIALPAATDVPDVVHEWVEVARYVYEDQHGRAVQEVVREECRAAACLAHKTFRQVFITADGRRVKTKPSGFTPVLYRAARVAAAVAAGESIWLLEGEKDVHTAERVGLVATTNTQGGRNFPDVLVDGLAGAAVNVVLDRDATGWARGLDLHRKLSAVSAAVRLWLPVPTDPKSDFTDHVAAGHAVADLLPVHLLEVEAWNGVAAAQERYALLEQAAAEVYAHLRATSTDDPAGALHHSHARRWALECQVRQEALSTVVDQVHAAGLRTGTEWAGEAMQAADELLLAATTCARQCHEAAGVAVPESLRLPKDSLPPSGKAPAAGASERLTGPAADPGHGAGAAAGRSFPGRPGATVAAPVFRVLDGQIVQWEQSRRRGGDEDEDEGTFKAILSLAVRVLKREYLEVEADHDVDTTPLRGRAAADGQTQLNPTAPRQLIAVVVAYPDPITGESMHLRITAEQWQDHSWLQALPGPVDYDHRRAGLDTVQRAILAISEDVEDCILYRSTGWRGDEASGYRFVHAGGVITAGGAIPAPVAFDGALARYNLPDPTDDVAALREAFVSHSAGMLDRLPRRVAAPLLGWMYRSVLGHNPWVLTLVGPPGSYKTSVAAKAMHHLGEMWEHHKPGSSMSGNGDTLNALRYKLHAAKDVAWWCDDFAPTKSWLDAQRYLEETARLIHNQEGRSRSSRDGMTVTDGSRPRASGLLTSEVMPRPGSGAERMLVVPLSRDDVDTDRLFPLDLPDSRHARALLISSFIRWLAQDLLGRRALYLGASETHAATFVANGQSVRQAAALAHIRVGWTAMTDYLLEIGALSQDEHDKVLDQVDTALLEAAEAAVNPDLPSRPGARVLEIVGYALRSGLAYVDDVRTGDCPPWPLAGRLGWRRTVTEVDGLGQPLRTRMDRNGIRLGYVLHDPGPRDRGAVLMVESTALEAVLKSATGTMAERFEIDRTTACRALYDEGVLIADESELAQGKIRFTLKNTVHCEGARSQRLVTLWLDKVLGDGTDDDSVDGGAWPAPDGAPTLASLFSLDADVENDPAAEQTSESEPSSGGDGAERTEEPVQPAFTSRPYTDADGVVGWTQPCPTPGPCLVCGVRCGVLVSGARVHLTCWEASTAAERQGRQGRDGADDPAVDAVSEAPGTLAPASSTCAGDLPSLTDREVGHMGGPAVGAAPQQPVLRPSAKTRTISTFRAAAAVVDIDGVWCSNGERLDLPDIRHVGDLAELAWTLNLGTPVTKWRDAAAQIWVCARLLERIGIDVATISATPTRNREKACREVTQASPAVTDALTAGYRVGGGQGDALGRWTRVWRGSAKPVWIVLLPAMNDDGVEVPLLAGAPTPAVLARRLGLLAGALGMPYQLSGSTTGLDLMMSLRWKDRESLFSPRTPVLPATLNVERDLSWSRRPTDEEVRHQYVHAYDRSGSYLAGVAGLELGIGEPEHLQGDCSFRPKTPGYWRIEVPEPGDWRMPNPLDPRGDSAGRVRWVTTPSLEFALEQGYEPAISEAYLWPEHARILDPWYERVRDARTRLDTADDDAQVARAQLKAIYAPTIGMLGSSTHMDGRAGYAPDRRHMIVSKARTNILRRVAQIGRDADRWPVAIVADTVIYTSPDPDPVASWPGRPDQLGRALGQYKVEGTGLLSEQVAYLTGGTYRGKPALVGDTDPGGE